MSKISVECPHCDNGYEIECVQRCDELMWVTDDDMEHHIELWQCDNCGGYFRAHFRLTKIEKLISVTNYGVLPKNAG